MRKLVCLFVLLASGRAYSADAAIHPTREALETKLSSKQRKCLGTKLGKDEGQFDELLSAMDDCGVQRASSHAPASVGEAGPPPAKGAAN